MDKETMATLERLVGIALIAGAVGTAVGLVMIAALVAALTLLHR